MNAKVKVKKEGRKRRTPGWTLLTLGLLVAGVWVASGWWSFDFKLADAQRYERIQNGCWTSSHETQIGALTLAEGTWTLQAARSTEKGWQWRAPIDYLRPFRRSGLHTIVDLFLVTYYRDEPLNSFLKSRGYSCSTGHWDAMLWPIPLLLWAPAALLLRSGILARRRAVKGMCAKCGYSLAGLAAGSPCPECGKKAKAG